MTSLKHRHPNFSVQVHFASVGHKPLCWKRTKHDL